MQGLGNFNVAEAEAIHAQAHSLIFMRNEKESQDSIIQHLWDRLYKEIKLKTLHKQRKMFCFSKKMTIVQLTHT